MFIKHFFTMFVQDNPIVSISVRIFMRTLFLVKYFLKLLSMNVKIKSATVVWCAEQNCVLKQVHWWNRRIFLRIGKTFDSVLLYFWQKLVSGRYSIENFVEISLPSKHLLVLKASSRHVLKTSSIRLPRNNFTSSKSSWRRLAKTFCKTSWRRLGRRKIVSLKTSWRYVLKKSWRYALKMSWRHVLKTS